MPRVLALSAILTQQSGMFCPGSRQGAIRWQCHRHGYKYHPSIFCQASLLCFGHQALQETLHCCRHLGMMQRNQANTCLFMVGILGRAGERKHRVDLQGIAAVGCKEVYGCNARSRWVPCFGRYGASEG